MTTNDLARAAHHADVAYDLLVEAADHLKDAASSARADGNLGLYALLGVRLAEVSSLQTKVGELTLEIEEVVDARGPSSFS